MVTHIFHRPSAAIEFVDTVYKPGQILTAVINIDSGDESHHIRHGTLSLHYTVRFSESTETMYAIHLEDTALLRPPRPRSNRTTKQIVQEYVMSSTEFITDEHVGVGRQQNGTLFRV